MIKQINKELKRVAKTWDLELEINDKLVYIRYTYDDDLNLDSGWEFLEDYNLTDEEIDEIDEYLNNMDID